MADTKYIQLARECLAPIPRASEKLLVIEGFPHDWPCSDKPGMRGTWSPCFLYAKYFIRIALENGCTHIEIHKGVHHRHRFDVGTLLMQIKRELGGKLPRPRHHPTLLKSISTRGQRARGNWTDTLNGSIAVPVSISGIGRLKGV